MTNNTQLPADTIADIKDKATKYSKGDMHLFVAYTEIATEYASKLHQANKDKLNLQMSIKGIEDQLTVERVKGATTRALLEKFISRHEAGLLPDRFLYNEIKQFLDGTK